MDHETTIKAEIVSWIATAPAAAIAQVITTSKA